MFQWIFQNKIKHMLLVIFLDALRTIFLTMIISKPKIEMHYHIWKYYTDSGLQVLNKFPVDLKGKAWSFSTLLHGWLLQWLFLLVYSFIIYFQSYSWRYYVARWHKFDMRKKEQRIKHIQAKKKKKRQRLKGKEQNK